MRILVNAIPLNNISTGISRYLRCLYTALGEKHPTAEFVYFDGHKLVSSMPDGPKNQASWSLMAKAFWKLPPRLALMVRMGVHRRREKVLYRLAGDFDVYHEAGFFPFAVPAGVRTVFTLHDVSILRFPRHHPRERVLYYEHCLRPSLERPLEFLTVSEFSAREIVAVLGIDRRNITVTPLAHDPQVFGPVTSAETNRIRIKYSLPEKYFFIVASGDPRKNTDVLPPALEASGLGIPLVWAGWTGWEAPRNTTGLIPIGHVPDRDLPGLYAGALAFVFPSIYEGFGLPVLEAMSCGCPVITTDRASLPEVGGEAVLYCRDARDPDAWSRLLRRVAEDQGGLRKELQSKGRERAGTFSWEQTADLTWEVLLGKKQLGD